MIRTVADLFEQLRAKELEALARFGGVGHQGMVGDMYEGLTRAVLERTLFGSLDLRVVTGKIHLGEDSYSQQIDAMVVVGDGVRMPHTDHFLYPPDQVLAAIEVKKTLYAEALDESYKNLQSVRHSDFLKHADVSYFRYVFRCIAGSEIPDNLDLRELPWHKQMLAHALKWDVALPVRMVFGYGGYRSERTLREGLLDYLDRVLLQHQGDRVAGYGPASLPNLIVCGQSTLVKTNAMPYSINHGGDKDSWIVYASYNTSPGLLLLEVLWTRLVALNLVTTDVFGEDLETEPLKPLLLAKPDRNANGGGWTYEGIPLTTPFVFVAADSHWEPTRLSDPEAALLHYLTQKGAIDTKNDGFWRQHCEEMGDALPDSLRKLRLAGLVGIDDDGVLKFLTERCQLVAHPQLGWVAAENATGRMTRWLFRDDPCS